ncbi:MAG: carbamoyl phosphate synthase small subunit [Mycoplasmatales bacterium]
MKLVLETGHVFEGEAFGAKGAINIASEIIFATSMTGYQEIITDPSYYKQMVVVTYPLVGNYGINSSDFEAFNPHLTALIVNEYQEYYSHTDANQSLANYLEKHNVIGLSGIDTRALTNIIREYGCLKAIIVEDDVEVNFDELKAWQYNDHVKDVSVKQAYICPNPGRRIVLIDFGCKSSIVEKLTNRGCEVIVVPFNTSFDEIKRLDPAGIVLSNGPGDPRDLPEVVEVIKQLNGKYPMFGICLGNQLFGLATDCNIVKMKFGHHSSNHPVVDLETDQISITTQNHGYMIEENSIDTTKVIVTHKSLNDQSIEGIRSVEHPTFTVQFHPEGNQGPEVDYLFDRFIDLVEENHAKK